jgi:hypothetical protein
VNDSPEVPVIHVDGDGAWVSYEHWAVMKEQRDIAHMAITSLSHWYAPLHSDCQCGFCNYVREIRTSAEGVNDRDPPPEVT